MKHTYWNETGLFPTTAVMENSLQPTRKQHGGHPWAGSLPEAGQDPRPLPAASGVTPSQHCPFVSSPRSLT